MRLEGRPTYRGLIKADVDEAIEMARTEKQFFHYLKEKGYSFKFGKDITIRMERRERGLKLVRNFGEDYTLEAICQRILEQSNEKSAIQRIEHEPQKKTYVVRMHGTLPVRRKIGGLRGLYFHYCYLLGIFPKNRPPVNPKQLHFLLWEDLRKLDTISKETRLLCRYHIDTAEELFLYIENHALNANVIKLINFSPLHQYLCCGGDFFKIKLLIYSSKYVVAFTGNLFK